MECDTITNPCPSTPPSLPSPPPPFSASVTPQRSNACYNCRNLDHWAKECPNKTPKKSPSSTPGLSTNASNLPLVRCPCDRGACRILTSKTTKNPNRKFFTCPIENSNFQEKCNFFIWCDELAGAPVCSCGVGTCSLNRKSSGPDEGKWYFACRIKKNYGACDFFQWADSEVNSKVKRYRGASKGYSSPQPLAKDNLDKKETNSSDQFEVSNRDLVMQEVESCSPMMRESLEVFQPTAQSDSHSLRELWCRIAVSGDSITEDVIYQIIGLHVHGWLGRLAFPPSQCLKDPSVVPVICCNFPSFDPVIITEDIDLSNVEGSFLLQHTALSAETEKSTSQSPSQDARASDGALDEPLWVKDPTDMMQDNDALSKSILKKLGQSLFNIFESINPPNPEHMLKVAEAFFIPLQILSIECDPFVKAAKDYVHNITKLTSIEESMRERLSFEELNNLHGNEKVRFNNVSRLHTEALAEYRASHSHCQSLKEEVSRIKSMLVQREKQLSSCEAETSVLKARVDEASKDLSQSVKNIEVFAHDMERAVELEQQRESVANAAKAAFETAKVWLELID